MITDLHWICYTDTSLSPQAVAFVRGCTNQRKEVFVMEKVKKTIKVTVRRTVKRRVIVRR